MKKGKLIFLIILLAAGSAALFYAYPRWKAARLMQEKIDFACFSYELEAELDLEELPREQADIIETLAELTGIRTEALCSPVLRGSVWEDRIHILLYLQGDGAPAAEFYLGDDTGVINESLSYNVIRDNLVSQYGFLEKLMPKQEGDLYMTLEQIERLFGLDLSDVRGIGNPLRESRMTVGKYFALLLFMARQENSFERLEEHVELRVNADEEDMMLQAEVHNPRELLEEKRRLLSGLGLYLPASGVQAVKEISLTIRPNEGGEFGIPTELVNQDLVDILSEIRDWVKRIWGR